MTYEHWMNYEIRYKCPVADCYQDAPSKKIVQNHLEKDHKSGSLNPDREYRCFQPMCRFQCERRVDIRAHLRVYHNIRIDWYTGVGLKAAIKKIDPFGLTKPVEEAYTKH